MTPVIPAIKKSGLLCLAFVIAGCASPQIKLSETERDIAWTERQVQLQAIDTWNLKARSVLTLPEGVYSVGLSWKRQQEDFAITLEAPFGQGVFRIESDSALRPQYSLHYPEGAVLRNESPEALLEQAVGWSLPVGGLRHWILGLSRPESASDQQLDNLGRLSRLQQDGWRIWYQEYYDENPALPRKMILNRNEVELRIVVDSWQPQLAGPDRGAVVFPEFD